MNNTLLDAYSEAISAYAVASTVIYRHTVHLTKATAKQLQQLADAHVRVEAARATYFEALPD